MIPLSLLLALILAFGVAPGLGAGEGPPGPLSSTLIQLLIVLAGVGIAAVLAGGLLLRRFSLAAARPVRMHRRFTRASRLLDALNLGAFAWLLFGAHWYDFVATRLGLSRAVLIDEILVIGPFLLGQLAIWAALTPAEVLMQRKAFAVEGRPLFTHWLLKVRAALGLVLPGTLLYAFGSDLAARFWPSLSATPEAPLLGLVVLGFAVLVFSPLFVRIAWPTSSLPPGELRDRLEALATRLGFRCTDILVWDTDGAILNAGITGTLPIFRYVLLTDALIERLDGPQIEAVFGHEVGHVAHHHLGFFGFFFIGSVGLLALLGQVFDWALGNLPTGWMSLATPGGPSMLEWTAVILCLLVLALYIFVVFGILSRRFERQADVYGTRAVSCGQPDCPPHFPSFEALPLLCPAGIQTFTEALASVALYNGVEATTPSWRHGSIDRRIRFLHELQFRPEAEERFQLRLRILRFGLATVLLAGLVAAAATGALAQL